MKHPNENIEKFEFNLGKAPELRCVHRSKATVCGTCEACYLNRKLAYTKSWFKKSGDHSRKRFILGLIRRVHSVELIQYVINILNPLVSKDFTYARARPNPGLYEDKATMSSDRALDATELEKLIAETWQWFQVSNYWTKSNFLLGLFQECESHLLHLIGIQARTALASEKNISFQQDDYEASSIASSNYTFKTEEHSELELLRAVKPGYTTLSRDPLDAFEAGDSTNKRVQVSEIINDDSGDEFGSEDSGLISIDPTLMVIPASAKAHSGVSRYKDFLRCLPVHISKYILSMLDQVALHNCVCVSRHWRELTEQVHEEYYVNQQLWEEVMLMQGGAAQGANPVYAKDIDVVVPNLYPDTWQCIRTDDKTIETTFKSEVNFDTAYTGYSTRKIIMEERNVYCGAYNVMVLAEQADPTRVVDTDGSNLVVVGSQDRKVRFINTETAKEVEPVGSGHAGTIRCVALCQEKGYAISGSYDTSIRGWSLETGKTKKIFRGHRDTVLCLQICGDLLVSGAKDKMCKVWDIETGKCRFTFKHRHAVTAVALSCDMCISGCEAGKVKVWDMKSGQLIKKLSGHHGAVTGIKFDRWHIITSSKDSYALAWSSQGNHSRCLTAYRHPQEVLCVEFLFLRVITGSADGKLRIWNMLSGHCLRIMRGNSRSDPICQLIAINDRITISTSSNLLVLNFEAVEHDYTLEEDKMPPLVRYSKYSDAPIRPQPYPYVRAQRMKVAGASNTKLIYHDERQPPQVYYRNGMKPQQTPQSAKPLSRHTMELARRVQSAAPQLETARHEASQSDSRVLDTTKKTPTTLPSPGKDAFNRPKPAYAKSLDNVGGDSSSEDIREPPREIRRRVSWAFEHPFIPKTKELNLSETKALLRSQIRAKGDNVPPDFIYLSVNAIQTSMKPNEASQNMEKNQTNVEIRKSKKVGRPSSSPGRIDPRTKMLIEKMQLEKWKVQGMFSTNENTPSEVESKASSRASSVKSRTSMVSDEARVVPTTTTVITEFGPVAVDAKPHMSLHSSRVKSAIPSPSLLRPQTACVLEQTSDRFNPKEPKQVRSKSALNMRPGTGQSVATVVTRAIGPSKQPKYQNFNSCATEVSIVPMLMQPADIKAKMAELRQKRIERQAEKLHSSTGNGEPVYGRVSKYNDPLRTHINFKLLTHGQVEKQLADIAISNEMEKKMKAEQFDEKKRATWLAKVKGQTNKNFSRRPRPIAPEIREYSEIESVS